MTQVASQSPAGGQTIPRILMSFGVVLLTVLAAAVLATVAVSRLDGLALWILLVVSVLVAVLGSLCSELIGRRPSTQLPYHSDILFEMSGKIGSALAEENRDAPFRSSPDEARQDAAMQNIKRYLQALEEVLKTSWSNKKFGTSTELEVVLMSRAQDGFVTVAAWANRRPKSLVKRIANPKLYDRTEAANLYRKYDEQNQRSPILIISDVSKHPNYEHFQHEPSRRTHSTALFPVYDGKSNLQGFIAVTARERTGFFEESDRRFWSEVWMLWEQHFVRAILTYEQVSGRRVTEHPSSA